MVCAEDRIAAALLNRYPILIFHACIPIGILLHPVDVGIAARHPYGMAGRAAEVVGAVVVDDVVAVGEVDGFRVLSVHCQRESMDFASLQGYGGSNVTLNVNRI